MFLKIPADWLIFQCFQATGDLEDIDKERRKEFKEYEMTKEHLRREQLKKLDEAARAKAQADYEAAQRKHKQHPKVNHPVSVNP